MSLALSFFYRPHVYRLRELQEFALHIYFNIKQMLCGCQSHLCHAAFVWNFENASMNSEPCTGLKCEGEGDAQ